MSETLLFFFVSLASYLVGSISSAVLICRAFSLPDPRIAGSNNPGATNVFRLGGKWPAFLTFCGDGLKGFIPVIFAKLYGLAPFGISLVTISVLLGHFYPFYFKFKGGKGVATAFGCFIALSLPLGGFLALTWIIIFILFRYSSLAALITALTAPFYSFYFTKDYMFLTIIISILLILKHRHNIINLWHKKEKKFR